MGTPATIKGFYIAFALDKLDVLGPDQYFFAFGPDHRGFYASPNGYTATDNGVPDQVLNDLQTRLVKQIVWASFGDHLESYFFAYALKDGDYDFRYGNALPAALKAFVDQIMLCNDLRRALRVQLGANGSFVAWANNTWACNNIPHFLRMKLTSLSSMYLERQSITNGSFKNGPLSNVTWHGDGSWYVNTTEHDYNWQTAIVRQGWNHFWGDHEEILKPTELADLAYATLNPHSPECSMFVFIKKKMQTDTDPDTVLRLMPEQGTMLRSSPTDSPIKLLEEDRVQHFPKPEPTDMIIHWAISKRTGQPHPTDSWELPLKQGDRVGIVRDLGKDWYLAKNRQGVRGWVHKSWLDFNDPPTAYTRFSKDINKLLVPGELRHFPDLTDYINYCGKDECKSAKQGDLGICVHDLHRLLSGSDRYCLGFVKQERTLWHPDKFAQFCHPQSRDALKTKAEKLFVLFGLLVDGLQKSHCDG